MMSTYGFSIAAITRAVISSFDCEKCECTEATVRSKPRGTPVPVDLAVGIDVQLGAVQQLHLGVRRAEPVDLLALRQDLVVGHPLHVEVGRVVGDREVAIAELARAGDHLLEAREAVGQVRVRVEVPLELLHREEGRELAAIAASTSPRSSRSVGSIIAIPSRS